MHVHNPIRAREIFNEDLFRGYRNTNSPRTKLKRNCKQINI